MRTISKVLGETQFLKFLANKPMNITLKISQFGLKHLAKVPRKIKGSSRLLLDITNYFGKGSSSGSFFLLDCCFRQESNYR